MSNPVTHVYEVYIRTTAEKLWDAITNGAVTPQYIFSLKLNDGPLAVGSPMKYYAPDGSLALDGNVLEIEPGRKLVQTWKGMQHAEDPASRVTWEITPLGNACKLSVTHEHEDAQSATSKGTQEGWPIVLSSLKTYLETGAPLQITWPEPAATTA